MNEVEPIPFRPSGPTSLYESREERPPSSLPEMTPAPPPVEPPPSVPPEPPLNFSGLSQDPPQSRTGEATAQAKTFLAKGGGNGESKFKPLLIIVLILFLLGGIGGAFYKFVLPKLPIGGTATDQKKEVTLTYWGLWEEDNVLASIFTDYKRDHPNVNVVYEKQSPRDYRERLQSAFARGEGPDLFRFHNTWVPMLKNELTPIPPTVLDNGSFEAIYYPVARADLKVGTSYMGIPLEYDGLALFINRELFKNAAKGVPKTWDELRKTALELVSRDSQGQIQVAGVALGVTENVDHWSDILALMMLQNGADLANPQGKLAEDALTYYTVFFQVDNVWDKTLPASTLAFAGGKLAMYFGPSWEAFEIKTANPALDFEIVPVPQLPDTNVTWASYWVEGVSKKSKKQEEAWALLKYLSSKEVMQKLYQASSGTRLFGEPYARTDMAAALESQPYVGAFIKQAPMARSWYLASKTFDNGINDKIIQYYASAVNAVNQGKSAKDALTTAGQGVSQVLATYGLSSPVVR